MAAKKKRPAQSTEQSAEQSAEQWESLDSLTPWDKNPRKNQAVTKVAQSLISFAASLDYPAGLLYLKYGRQAGHRRNKARESQEAHNSRTG